MARRGAAQHSTHPLHHPAVSDRIFEVLVLLERTKLRPLRPGTGAASSCWSYLLFFGRCGNRECMDFRQERPRHTDVDTTRGATAISAASAKRSHTLNLHRARLEAGSAIAVRRFGRVGDRSRGSGGGLLGGLSGEADGRQPVVWF